MATRTQEHMSVYCDTPALLPNAPPVYVPFPENTDNSLQLIRRAKPVFHPSQLPFEGATIITPLISDWRYEDRHQAQQLLSYLWLGPSIVAKSPNFFSDTGITLAIGVSAAPTKFMVSAALQRIDGLGVATVYQGIGEEPIPAYFTIFNLIRDHYLSCIEASRPCRILVFDDTGNGKAVSVVSAYMMQAYEGVDYIKAVQLTQAVRFSAGWHDEAKQILSRFWEILCASRAVASVPPTTPKARKMKRDLTRDEDDDMVEWESQELAQRRTYAPFRDSLQADEHVLEALI